MIISKIDWDSRPYHDEEIACPGCQGDTFGHPRAEVQVHMAEYGPRAQITVDCEFGHVWILHVFNRKGALGYSCELLDNKRSR